MASERRFLLIYPGLLRKNFAIAYTYNGESYEQSRSGVNGDVNVRPKKVLEIPPKYHHLSLMEIVKWAKTGEEPKNEQEK